MVRARAFDMVYNMAIHGELLLPTEAGKMAEEMEVSSCTAFAADLACLLWPCLLVGGRGAGKQVHHPCRQVCSVEAVSLLG